MQEAIISTPRASHLPWERPRSRGEQQPLPVGQLCGGVTSRRANLLGEGVGPRARRVEEEGRHRPQQLREGR